MRYNLILDFRGGLLYNICLTMEMGMASYTATVTIKFDDEDIQELCDHYGIDYERVSPVELLHGSLDNLDIGQGFVEQIVTDND